ncbi:MAG: DUF4835 family protein, partial [Bacteroidota bacterium]
MLKRMVVVAACLCLSILSIPHSHAQEVDATVTVNYEAVATTNKDLLQDFESDIKMYLSNYQWGTESQDVKVECTFDIRIQGVVGDNRYSAQMFVGSKRKLYGSGKNTIVLRLFDESW